MESRQRTFLMIIMLSAIGILVIAGLWLFTDGYEKVKSLFSSESILQLVDYLRSLGWIGPLVSVGLMMLQSIAAPLPSFVIAAANGMVYGVSGIGQIPGTLLYVLLGHDLTHIQTYQNRLWIVAGTFIGFIIFMKWRSKTGDINHSKEAFDIMKFKELCTIQDWRDLFAASLMKQVLLFKHSTTCPISAEAWREFQDFVQHAKEEQIEAAMVKEIESRVISNL